MDAKPPTLGRAPPAPPHATRTPKTAKAPRARAALLAATAALLVFASGPGTAAQATGVADGQARIHEGLLLLRAAADSFHDLGLLTDEAHRDTIAVLEGPLSPTAIQSLHAILVGDIYANLLADPDRAADPGFLAAFQASAPIRLLLEVPGSELDPFVLIKDLGGDPCQEECTDTLFECYDACVDSSEICSGFPSSLRWLCAAVYVLCWFVCSIAWFLCYYGCSGSGGSADVQAVPCSCKDWVAALDAPRPSARAG